MNSLYPQQSHASNVLPMSGHIVQPGSSSRYIQPGQGHQQRQAMYRQQAAAAAASSQPPHQAIKRTRSPISPPSTSYYPSAVRSVPSTMFGLPGYPPPPLISTQANNAARDLLKEAVSQHLGVSPSVGTRERELLASLGQGRDILAGMGAVDREMFAKGLAGLGGGHEMPALNLASVTTSAAVAKETENYARYLASFQQQLEAGNKTAVAAAALSELDRARLVSQTPPSSLSLSRPGYYSQDLGPRGFPSPR